MAEAIMRHEIRLAHLETKITVDSAGTANWHEGKQPHQGTSEKLDEVEVSYEGMLARQINKTDFHEFDYIITMDDSNMSDLRTEFNMSDKVDMAKVMDFVENPKKTYQILILQVILIIRMN